MYICSLMMLAASLERPRATSDAACCSCSSGYAAVEDGYLRVEACLRGLLVYSVSFSLDRSQSSPISRRIFNSNTDLQTFFFQFPYPDSDAAQRGVSLNSQVPPCETGCAASMLGLEPVNQIQLLNYLKASIHMFI